MPQDPDRLADPGHPINRLEEAWKQFPPAPRFGDFLTGDRPIDTELLAQLIRIDAQHRLKRNEPIRLEFYRDATGAAPSEVRATLSPEGALTAAVLGFERIAGNDPDSVLNRLGSKYEADVRRAFDSTDRTEDATLPPTDYDGPQPPQQPAVGLNTWKKGDRIGAFTLRKRLGSGGFGEVWLASRENPRLQVAIKVLRPDVTDADSIKRFEAEAQALAFLEHRYIAKIIDAGTVRAMPYLVMEYVEGKTLTRYCDDKRLSITQRLELMARICEGVQHAHLRGLIHRDLKPDNILVTEITKHPKDLDEHEHSLIVQRTDGKVTLAVPKIVDFGLAKAAEKTIRLADGTLTLDLGKMMGTPEYMSPEQAGHQPLEVTQQADIFSLGVILYELLTGTPPLTKEELRERILDEMIAILRGTPRPDLSTRLSRLDAEKVRKASYQRGEMSPRELEQRLRSRVRHLCGKALRLEPERRFSSSAAMAMDIRNYIADRDFIEAAAEPRREKLLRHMKRHKPMYAATTLVAVFLMLATAGSVYGVINAKEAQTQEARAIAATIQSESQAARVRELVDVMLIDVHDAVQRLPDATEARRIILEIASRYLDEIASEEGADDPLVLQQLARAHDRVGDLLGGVRGASLGKYSDAMSQYLEARRIRDSLDQQTRDSILADTINNHIKVGDIWIQEGDTEKASIEYQRAADLVEEHRAHSSPEDLELQRKVLITLTDLARIQGNEGNTAAALDINRRTLKIAVRLVAAAPEDDRFQRDLGLAHSTVGERLRALGDLDAAIEHHQRAFEIRSHLVAQDQLNRTYRRDFGLSHLYIGLIQLELGDRTSALRHAEESTIIACKLAIDDANDDRARRELTLPFRGLLHLIIDESDEPENTISAIDRIRAELTASFRENDAPSARIRGLIAELEARLALRQGNPEAARQALQTALRNLTNSRKIDTGHQTVTGDIQRVQSLLFATTMRP